jgi:hypothetical protein
MKSITKKITRNLFAAFFVAGLLFTACMEDEVTPLSPDVVLDEAIDLGFTDGEEKDTTGGPIGT